MDELSATSRDDHRTAYPFRPQTYVISRKLAGTVGIPGQVETIAFDL